MKSLCKSIVAFVLGLVARVVIHKYQPQIVMVTGSVGKTSTKDAVAVALSARFFVRKSAKSFNSEFGVPFTILGVKNPWHNPLAWIGIAKSALALLILPNHYPNMLVLEIGADRPGDLARILRVATPDVVVVTRLPDIPVHVEAYLSPEAVREEEFSPAYALRPAAPLIISSDKPHAIEMAKHTSARVISYGINEDATVHVRNIDFHETDGKIDGMAAEVLVEGDKGILIVKGSVGKIQILPLAAALAAAIAFKIALPEALGALEKYEPPPGRGRLFAGKNDSVIIDDSYNSSPAALEEALATLKTFPHAKRRIAVLGVMLELGRYSVEEHGRIGALAASSADVVVAVGIRARAFAAAGKNVDVILFDNSRAAAKSVVELVRPGDVILVKGSQSIRTERIVEALLADAADAAKLVRQEREWKKKA